MACSLHNLLGPVDDVFERAIIAGNDDDQIVPLIGAKRHLALKSRLLDRDN